MPKSEVRIDKWLWAVRVFKTRTVASEACKKGRVMIGDTVAKPARTVKVGDVVKVRKPPVTYSFKVLALTENRLGARLVPEYMENVTPISTRTTSTTTSTKTLPTPPSEAPAADPVLRSALIVTA